MHISMLSMLTLLTLQYVTYGAMITSMSFATTGFKNYLNESKLVCLSQLVFQPGQQTSFSQQGSSPTPVQATLHLNPQHKFF